MVNTNDENLEIILSRIGEKELQLSENRTKLISSIELLNQYKDEHPETADKVELVVEYDFHGHRLNVLKFVTSDFSLAESVNFDMHESGSGIEAIEGHVVYTLDLIAGKLVDKEENCFPIYCEDKEKLLNNKLREVGYTTSNCNCGPRQSAWGCPHIFSNGYSRGKGEEETIARFSKLGLSEELMAKVEEHVKTAYEKTDKELYARIGELKSKYLDRINEMLREEDDLIGNISESDN
jgi:hypothetical protein